MELFTKLFGSLVVLIYHCFDRIVINGYLSMLGRPEQVVYFFKEVLGIEPITKEVLGQRTREYQNWVEAYSRNQGIPIQWAEKKVRKEDYVQPWLKRMQRRQQQGVYFIFKSMEQGPTFRSSIPKYPTADPHYRILSKQRSRFTHYYFYILDEVLGPMVLRVASFLPFQTTYYLNGHSYIGKELDKLGVQFHKSDNAFLSVSNPKALQKVSDSLSPQLIRNRLEYWTLILGPKFSKRERKAMNLKRFYAISQIEYCRNFIFRRNHIIHKIFERSCELGLWNLTSDKISQIFGCRLTKRLRGKLATTLEKVEHGHHIFRAYFKKAFVKQYEKFSTFLRQEVCSNNLSDFRLKKGLDSLPAIRNQFLSILDRFTHFQAQTFNIPIDFPLFQRLSLPILIGRSKIPGIKIQDTRILRLMEVLIHSGTQLAGWRSRQLHTTILTTFNLSAQKYTLTQLRYDLRKMKAHGLVERESNQYSYRLSNKGIKTSLIFILFHKHVCGPLAHSVFYNQRLSVNQNKSKLLKTFQKADNYVHEMINILNAA
jgi:hypothetical protein